MSNKTLEYPYSIKELPYPPIYLLLGFFVAIGKLNKWYYQKPGSDERQRGGGFDLVLDYKTNKPVFFRLSAMKSLGNHNQLEINIDLVAHYFLPIYLVRDLDPHTTSFNLPPYLDGFKVLGHYDKVGARNDENIRQENVAKFWTISSASNLEALMRAYDNCARIYGCPTVFNLP